MDATEIDPQRLRRIALGLVLVCVGWATVVAGFESLGWLVTAATFLFGITLVGLGLGAVVGHATRGAILGLAFGVTGGLLGVPFALVASIVVAWLAIHRSKRRAAKR